MLDIFQKAKGNNYAVGAFNVSNLEQLKAIIQAARDLKSPVIVATSPGESRFIGKKQISALVAAWRQETGLPMILHLDHGKSIDEIKEAIEAGYDSVHFDGSDLSLEENLVTTKQVVALAKEKEIKNIEGEVGYLRGKSSLQEMVEIKKEDLTDPEEALNFIKETGVDSLAIAIGNIHGIVKNESLKNPHLFLDRLAEINNQIADQACLVLHGGSGTPQEDIKEAVKLGIGKINVNTELRMAYTQSLKESLEGHPQEVTPYKIMPPVVEAVKKIVEEKIKLFGSENRI